MLIAPALVAPQFGSPASPLRPPVPPPVAADPRPKLVLTAERDAWFGTDVIDPLVTGWAACDRQTVPSADHFFAATGRRRGRPDGRLGGRRCGEQDAGAALTELLKSAALWDHLLPPRSPEGSRLLADLGPESGITWYDVLGVLPGATAEQVRHQHDAKARLLRPELIAGAPSPVVAAASRAQEILSTARRVLTDPANRARYDETAGLRRGGDRPPSRSFPAQPAAEPPDLDFIAGDAGLEALGALLMLGDWMAPHPRPPRRVAVPDVRGLFYSVCLGIAGKLGFRLDTVRLTEHPLPVDGLVVGQFPGPAVRARRGSALTVRIWHPSAR